MSKILVLGNRWHGNWSTTVSSELQALGHESDHVDVRYTPSYRNKYLEKINRKIFTSSIQRTLLNQVENKKYDYCIVITPYDIPIETYNLIKQKNIKLVGWWGDDPMIKGVISETMTVFDKIFLVDKSWINKSTFFNKKVDYLPHAFSPKHFFYQKQDKTHDVIFVGHSSKGKMDGHLRAQTLKLLHDNNIKVSLFGDKYWKILYPQYPCLKKMFKGQIENQEELNELYNSAKISLNIHHSQLETGTNQRTFEASGSRAFQVSDYKEVIENEFGRDIATYKNPEDLIKIVKFYLQNKKEREDQAHGAQQKALEKHTYAKRLESLLI